MIDDFIGIDVSGEEIIAAKLKKLPATAQDTVTDEVSKYMIKSILTIAPPKNYITRERAYGQTFFSDKQRRFFFAALADGQIKVPYSRSKHGLTKSWKQVGRGKSSYLYNEKSYAQYVIGDTRQSRHETLVGWLTISDTLKRYRKEIIEKADGAIKKAIKKLGL